MCATSMIRTPVPITGCAVNHDKNKRARKCLYLLLYVTYVGPTSAFVTRKVRTALCVCNWKKERGSMLTYQVPPGTRQCTHHHALHTSSTPPITSLPQLPLANMAKVDSPKIALSKIEKTSQHCTTLLATLWSLISSAPTPTTPANISTVSSGWLVPPQQHKKAILLIPHPPIQMGQISPTLPLQRKSTSPATALLSAL